MKRKLNITLCVLLFALCVLLFAPSAFAAGGADYGRGAETDPVGVAASSNVSIRATALETLTTNLSTRTTALQTLTTNTSLKVTALETLTTNTSIRITALAPRIAATATCLVTTNANGGTNTVVYTVKDAELNTLAAYVPMRVWVADTQYGAPAAVQGEVVVSGGIEVQEIVSKGDYWLMTAANGTVTVTVTDDPGRTNYIHAATGGGVVAPTELKWNVP